jgi:hypothetical protein
MKQDRNFRGFAHFAPGYSKVPHWTAIIPREKCVVRLLILGAWSESLVDIFSHSNCAALVVLCCFRQESNRPVFQINLSHKEHTKTAAQIESRAEFLRSKIAKAQKELDALGLADCAKTAGNGVVAESSRSSIDEASTTRLGYPHSGSAEVAMSVVTEILGLRQNQFSSMTTLLSAIERRKDAYTIDRLLRRSYAVTEAADALLTNVAAHCAEALSEPPTIPETRRAVVPFRRKPRRSDSGRLHQRRLFA